MIIEKKCLLCGEIEDLDSDGLCEHCAGYRKDDPAPSKPVRIRRIDE
jgi:hypothetical protein